MTSRGRIRFRSLPNSLGLLLALCAPGALAQVSSDTGTVQVSATASPYVEFASGGLGSLTGNLGGGIAGAVPKGSPLAGVSIGLGEIGPSNLNAFVKAAMPLRVRSNAGYTLTMAVTAFADPDPLAIQPSDVGFGVTALARTDTGVIAGTDVYSAGSAGDPTTAPDADPATVRWDYASGQHLATFVPGRSLLTGTRIMRAVPKSLLGGLTFNAVFCVKPQFFSPGGFSTTVTYTVVTP